MKRVLLCLLLIPLLSACGQKQPTALPEPDPSGNRRGLILDDAKPAEAPQAKPVSEEMKVRDQRRISDINTLVAALELYYGDEHSYPATLTPGKPLASAAATYMPKVPANPRPQTDGGCGDRDYTYIRNGSSFIISFCLGSDSGALKKGINTAGPQGITGMENIKAVAPKKTPIAQKNSSAATARDQRRVADIRQLISGLELYYNDHSAYPKTLKAGQRLLSADGKTTYITVIPANPKPRTDGGCPDKEYEYKTSAGTYTIAYCLGADSGSLKAGPHTATDSGLDQPKAKPAATTDQKDIISRDQQRYKDIRSLANLLRLYFNINQKYPEAITPGKPFMSADGKIAYGRTPSNPQPRNDGSCADKDYEYISDGRTFSLSYCLGAGLADLGLKAGIHYEKNHPPAASGNSPVAPNP